MLPAMQKYDAYKDSGVEWLEEIPQNWTIRRLKFLTNISTGEKNTEDKKSNGCYPFFVRSQQPERIDTYSYDGEAILTAGDGAGVGKIYHYVDGKFDYHQRVYKLSNFKMVIGKLLFYYLKSNFYSIAIQGTAKSTVDSLRLPLIQNFLVCFPTKKDEQQAIANYLDEKTAQIDQAMSIKEKQITLLKERKQIMIQNAVTRGLNPDVAMRDSGVEWLREIPEHWEIMRLKFLVKIRYGLGQPPRELDLGLPIIRATNIERGKITNNEIVYVDPSDIPWDRNPVLKKNDIIVVRSGAYTGDSAIVTKDYEGSIAGYDMVMTPFLINPKFIAFSMLAHYVLYDQLYLLRIRSAQPHLNAEELGETVIVFPSQKEQQAIVAHIEAESTKIDQAINIQQQQIENLKEYRSTLINSAVTGKIKVV